MTRLIGENTKLYLDKKFIDTYATIEKIQNTIINCLQNDFYTPWCDNFVEFKHFANFIFRFLSHNREQF